MASGEIILGIDLGTTYSTAAALIGGKLHFALDARGEACVPSVVYYPRVGQPLVGVDAEKMRATDPAHTVSGIKRVLGRSIDSPAARLLDAASAFKLGKLPSGEIGVLLNQRLIPATEIAAVIVRHLRERAEARFRVKLQKCVFTVPVLATQPVRDAMHKVGKLAGLEVVRIITEPSAGALAHGFATPTMKRPSKLLVYDFGGGTFDATVVQMEPGHTRVLSAGGDDCLGGDNFDLTFSQKLQNQLWRSHGVDLSKDLVIWDRIQRMCERVKRALSQEPTARFRVPEAFSLAGKTHDLDFVARRDNLELEWGELVDRSVEATRVTLEKARLEAAQIDQVVLIGGTTAVPIVSARVQEALGRPMIRDSDPQTAVARGAALLAAQGQLLPEAA